MDKKFIINLQGKSFITFEGLLAEFFTNKGKSIKTEELSNSTVLEPKFKATVSGEKGTFTGHGDANNTNVNIMVAKHKYRMAETRAIARALRWYNNIGMCSVDELGGSDNKQPVIAGTASNTAQVSNKCQKCGADMVLNPKTGKHFCKEKCWLKPVATIQDGQIAPAPENFDEQINNIPIE